MARDTGLVSRASSVVEPLAARARRVAARAGFPLAGGGLLGGGGFAAVVAATGGCPFCVVGVPCPICLLGAGPAIGSVVTGGLGALGVGAWTGRATRDGEDADGGDEEGDDGRGERGCGCRYVTRRSSAGCARR